ncbi:MAG: sensor histidine kinase [Pirellulales bacterium]|nr:sensor histidine kinase [Pirellulales bacterium]
MHLRIHHDAGDESLVSGEAAASNALGDDPSLAVILEAWNDATLRLQQTHEALQSEVARLTDELAAKDQELARQNRLADLGRMASHVAHEVRNSLVPVNLYLSLLRRRLSGDAGSLDVLAKVEAGFTALDATVNDLLNFTAHREPHWRSFIVQDLIEEIFESLAPQLEAQGIELSIDVPPHTVVTADREMLRRAILNLALNAVDAMPQGGDLVVTSYERQGGLELEIADSGPGVPAENLPRLFDPFFTTKAAGTGLGLSIVNRIVAAHGGQLTVSNCPEGGAAFTIELPARRARGMAA